MWYRDFYPTSRPREAKGGIKAKSKRGSFGESWWAKRWISVLESFNIGARLGRGRSYARNGQVLSVDIESGEVKSKVQGSSPMPYSITIGVKTLTIKEWEKVAQVLSEQAIFSAKLLAGEMPEDIEVIFAKAGVSLFPEKLKDLTTECSCPDWSNPCKHIAAVYYLLGEEFDRDPFLLFRLRGMDREDLVKKLGQHETSPTTSDQPVATAEPLPVEASAFWSSGQLAEDFFGPVQAPPVHAALPKRLGGFPFWRGNKSCLDALEPLYEVAARRGMEVFLGEKKLPNE